MLCCANRLRPKRLLKDAAIHVKRCGAKVQYANPLYRLPMTFAEIFPVGLLVSLVTAGPLRNSVILPAQRGDK
jgi:hypothetical protein